MTKTNEYYVFHLNDHVKQNRPGYVFSTVFVRRYQPQEVCVYRKLEHYLDRTAAIRRSNKLLVSFVKPHDKISTNTSSRWIRTL